MTDTAPAASPAFPDHPRRAITIIAAAAAVVILVGSVLPLVGARISSATTRYSGGTVRVAHFDVLVHRQLHRQSSTPLNEEFVSVEIELAGPPVSASAWGWLGALCSSRSILVRHLSAIVCLLLPVSAAVAAMALAALEVLGRERTYALLIPATIRLSGLAIPAIVLSWLHHIDFSGLLLSLARPALQPGIGFWVSLAAAIVVFGAVLPLRKLTRTQIINWWALVLAVALGIWLLVRLKPYPFLDIWNFVYDGILVTLRIVATSFGFILLVSLLGGLGRISRSKIIYGIASLYVEIIRGIPLLVQLLFIWFALPQVFDGLGIALQRVSPSLNELGQRLIDLRLSPFTAAVVGLTTCYGAYGSEIFRAGISSIHHGQMEAARSLGMSYLQAMRYIILPQAIRVILPPVGNEFVALLKDSSLVSVLAVSDLTRRGREYMARTFLSFDTWIMVALCYLVLTLFSSRAVEFIESKTRFER